MNVGSLWINTIVPSTSNRRVWYGKTGNEPLWERASTDIALQKRNLDWGPFVSKAEDRLTDMFCQLKSRFWTHFMLRFVSSHHASAGN